MRVKLAAVGLFLAELAFVGSFVYTHLTTFAGLNVGFNLNAPYDVACVGVEFWRDSHQVDAYLSFSSYHCKTD